MSDDVQFLLEMYKTQIARSAHYEDLRSSVTNRDALDALVPSAGINQIREAVPKAPTYLYKVWNALHVVIVVAGAVIVILALAVAG